MLLQTSARKLHNELGKEIETFRPWQYKDFNVISANYDAILDDIETYWEQQSRFREGFKIEENTITIPNFFTKINGIHKNKKDYEKFIKKLVDTPNTFIINNYFDWSPCSINPLNNETIKLDNFLFEYEDYKKNCDNDFEYYDFTIENILNNNFLGYYCYSNTTFNQLTSDKQKLLFKIMKQNIIENKDKKPKEQIEKFLSICLSLPEEIITLINNFDYSYDVPKIVVISNKINQNISILLNILNLLAIDIIILQPNGKSSIEKYMDIQELSLGYFVNDFDIENKLITTNEKVKEQVSIINNKFNFIKVNIIPITLFLITILGNIFVAFKLGNGINAAINGLSLCAIIVIILFVEDWGNGFLNSIYIILAFLLGIVLCGRGIYALSLIEPSTDKHSGFELSHREEQIGTKDYIMDFNPDALNIEDDYTLNCYIENNAKNTNDIYVKLLLGNSIIFESTNIKPLEYMDRISLDVKLPLGDNEITLNYYLYDETQPDPYTKELLGSTSIMVHTIEKDNYYELLKTYNLDFGNH